MFRIVHFFVICFILPFRLLGQFPGCPDIQAGSDVMLDCTVSCTTLVASPFDVGSTTSYAVESIPHNPPLAYNATGGTPLSVNMDDTWSPAITLPFTFCYFGQSYNKCVVGSNGTIKFAPNLANSFAEYAIYDVLPASSLKKNGDIFGVHHDIDPEISGNVNYFISGTAPCRIFTVIFNNMAHYGCPDKRSSFMMVLYETTNVIDIYVKRKDLCQEDDNAGASIIGIQNPINSFIGYTAPLRNSNPTWEVQNAEAWRFKPNGSSVVQVKWYKNGAPIGQGNAVDICPEQGVTNYVASASYASCNGTMVTKNDTIKVTKITNGLTINQTTVTPTICGASNGAISVQASGGVPGYTYQLDNGNFTSSNTFSNLANGIHHLVVKDAANCITTKEVYVGISSGFELHQDSIIPVDCFGKQTGKMYLSASGGNAPYTFSLSGQGTSSTGQFFGLSAGNYTVTLSDVTGCVIIEQVTINQPTDLSSIALNKKDAVCAANNGSITTLTQGGNPPYSFTINGGITNQSVGMFINLAGGSYKMVVTDSKACKDTFNFNITAIPKPIVSVDALHHISCYGANDGYINLDITGGTAPYNIMMDNSINQSSLIFSGLSSGSHTFLVTDLNNCTSQLSASINEPLPATINQFDSTICINHPITLAPSIVGGSPPYSYLWNNNSTSSSLTVSLQADANYSVTITDNNNCVYNASYALTTVQEPIPLASNNVSIGNPPLTVTFQNNSLFSTDYVWQFNNGQTIALNSTDSVTSIFQEIGNYTVVMTAFNDYCSNTWSTLIQVVPYDPVEFIIPNTFTPNGDGVNDIFSFQVKNAKTLKGAIVDRWGATMATFESDSFTWDGTFNGKPVDDGVYFISMEFVGFDGNPSKTSAFFHVFTD